MEFRLDGSTAMVTGCSRGIGKGLAVGLAQAGADIVGVSATLAASGSDVEREVKAHGRDFRGYACDFSNRQALYEFIRQVSGDGRKIDILINNAGTIRRKPAAEHSDEFWDCVMEVNLDAQFILSRELGREMLSRGRGKIVFIASMLTFQGGVNVVSYAASKGAIGSLVKALANEWAGKGVNVNAIAPGYIATDNTAALRADENRNRAILDRIPAGRWGTPQDLVGAAVFLSSPAAAYVHGTILAVDGGWLGR
ncbi:MAG TPA: SDR family oxidoreductase [Tepidisphaeraceae bacterium]|nr:SDR family oxidoreductase [Tepidisphaeraceae bacterium]